MSPIKPENKGLYPPDWDDIRHRVLSAQDWKCKWCKKPHDETVSVNSKGWWIRIDEERVEEVVSDKGELMGSLSTMFSNCCEDDDSPEAKALWFTKEVKVCLTVAHLDQNPQNNDMNNLAGLCQRCHLMHDAPHNQIKAAATRALKPQKAGQLPLLEMEPYVRPQSP